MIDQLDDDMVTAIKTAIIAGDPACPMTNIYGFRRNPVVPTPDVILNIFGAGSRELRIYHGWDMTKGSSLEEMQTAEDGGDTILTSIEPWIVRGFYTLQDEKSSELTWRKICANVQYQFRQHAAITNLIKTYDIYLDAASMTQFMLATLTGTEIVHYVEFSLVFRHEDHQ